jgi:hypothetical protein
MINNINESWFKKMKKKVKLIVTTGVLIVTLTGCLATMNSEQVHGEAEDNDYRYEYTGDSEMLQPYQSIYDTNNAKEEKKSIPEQYVEQEQDVIETIKDVEQQVEIEQPTISNNNTTGSHGTVNIDLNKRVSFSSININTFLQNIKNIKVNYLHSDKFYTSKALDNYFNMTEYNSSTNYKYIVNGKIDAAKLLSTVQANNKEYLANRQGNRYTEFSSSDFNMIFSTMVETLNSRLETADVAQLDYNLSRLKLLNTTDNGYGAVTDDDVRFTINVNNCRHVSNNDTFIKRVVVHESTHLSQISSDIEKQHEGYDLNRGIYYRWNNMSVNPMAYQWFTEASAEKLAQSVYRDRDNEVYKEWVKALDSMTLSAIVRDDVDGYTLPKISTQGDLNKLFAFFNATTRAEQEEIINMMFSYEIIFNKDKNFYSEVKVSDQYKYDQELQSSIALTLTKNFYYNLAEKLKSSDNITIEDIFKLLVLEEADLNRVCKYYNRTDDSNKKFINSYTAIQDDFFGMVASVTGISKNDLYQAFDDYYSYQNHLSSDSGMLTSAEQNFVDDVLSYRDFTRPYDNLFTFKK